MSHNPVVILLPYLKKYGMEFYISLGLLAWIMRRRSNNYTYGFVYSRNDFERRRSMDDLKEFLSHH